jgi:hypothetical protein
MINYKWLIALAKCRQIARQLLPSRGIDAILYVLYLILTNLTDKLTAFSDGRPSDRASV